MMANGDGYTGLHESSCLLFADGKIAIYAHCFPTVWIYFQALWNVDGIWLSFSLNILPYTSVTSLFLLTVASVMLQR